MNPLWETLWQMSEPGQLLRDEPMSRHTTFRIGGAVALMAKVRSEAEFAAALTAAFLDRCALIRRAAQWAAQHAVSAEALDRALAAGLTEIPALAERFCVTEDLMRRALCWHTHGSLEPASRR